MIKIPALQKNWARCTECGHKTVLFDNTANCSGVWLKCTRGCGKEFELVIVNGKQEGLVPRTTMK